MRPQDKLKIKNILESLSEYELFHYKIEDVRYPSNPNEFLRLEFILEKEAIEITQIDVAELYDEQKESVEEKKDLPKRYISNKGIKSLYQYLETLGIDRKEIYSKSFLSGGDSGRTEQDKRERGYGKDTIYKRFELYELESMIERARNKKIKEIHPDLHTQDKEYFGQETAKINNAFDKAMNILKWRGL